MGECAFVVMKRRQVARVCERCDVRLRENLTVKTENGVFALALVGARQKALAQSLDAPQAAQSHLPETRPLECSLSHWLLFTAADLSLVACRNGHLHFTVLNAVM